MRKAPDPWHASASRGATHQTYEIRTVADFLKVPEPRRRICLREFHSWMAIQEGVTDLLTTASNTLGDTLDPSCLKWENDVFRWRDDGEATIGVSITAPDDADEAQSLQASTD